MQRSHLGVLEIMFLILFTVDVAGVRDYAWWQVATPMFVWIAILFMAAIWREMRADALEAEKEKEK